MNTITALFFTAIIIWATPSDAQRTRRVTGATTKGCFRQQVPALSYTPPLHTDMNLNTLLAYVYMDSLCRSLTPHQIDSISSEITNGDTLKLFMKFLYAMTNYDPVLFGEYSAGGPYINTSYKSSPGAVSVAFRKQMTKILGNKNVSQYITESSLILHIQIANLWTDHDSLGTVWANPTPLQCVSAVILDTLKGQHILTSLLEERTKSSGAKPQSIDSGMYAVNFSFVPLWGKNDNTVGVTHDSLGNRILVASHPLSEDTLHIGSEYIVVLYETLLDYDGSHAFYNYRPGLDYNSEGGIFPIVSGVVQDPYNFWGAGVNPAYSTFITYLRNRIYHIANGN